MSVRKRNEYLEGDESDDEIENGYDSEAEEGRGAIANKRRKLDREQDDPSDISSDEAEPPAQVRKTAPTDSRFDVSRFVAEDEHPTSQPSDKPRKKKSKDLKAYEAAHKKAKKSGVVYISRVPPFMKPQTLKHFLEPHAPHGLGRIFLTPEDHTQHTQRVKNGGNKKKSFTDGWVEFTSKKEAKLAAEQLNGNIIGGKKGGFYHDDLWNMKYLKGFKWEHLTEQINNENAERAARIREEVRRTRKENRQFVEDVERGKMLAGMERKEKEKLERGGGDGGTDQGKEKGREKTKTMKFKQNKSVKEKESMKKKKEGKSGDDDVVAFGQAASLRSKIF